MNALASLVRFLFWLLVISWAVRLIRRIFGWMLRNASTAMKPEASATGQEQTPSASRRLVRDPVCGMHVDETLSIPLREGGELLHFCSLACRDAYTVGEKKFAAHG